MRYIIAENRAEPVTLETNKLVQNVWGWKKLGRHCFVDGDGEEARVIENPAFIQDVPVGTIVYSGGNLDKNEHADAFRALAATGKIKIVLKHA